MNTDHFQTTIKLKATRAIGQANINARSLAEYKIPLPSLEQQEQIVEQLTEERKLIGASDKLIKIFELKIRNKIAEVWGGEQPAEDKELRSSEIEVENKEEKPEAVQEELKQAELFSS